MSGLNPLSIADTVAANGDDLPASAYHAMESLRNLMGALTQAERVVARECIEDHWCPSCGTTGMEWGPCSDCGYENTGRTQGDTDHPNAVLWDTVFAVLVALRSMMFDLTQRQRIVIFQVLGDFYCPRCGIEQPPGDCQCK